MIELVQYLRGGGPQDLMQQMYLYLGIPNEKAISSCVPFLYFFHAQILKKCQKAKKQKQDSLMYNNYPTVLTQPSILYKKNYFKIKKRNKINKKLLN